jgi:hypothetical protein
MQQPLYWSNYVSSNINEKYLVDVNLGKLHLE